MPASMIVNRGEAKAIAIKQKASRAITKELTYLLSSAKLGFLLIRLGRLAGRCGVTAFRFLRLSLLLSPRSGSIVDLWTACNINYARIRIARAEKQDALGCASTRSSLRVSCACLARVSHVHAASTKGDSPLEEMSIQGRCRNHSLSNAVARSWTHLAALQAAHELLIYISQSL